MAFQFNDSVLKIEIGYLKNNNPFQDYCDVHFCKGLVVRDTYLCWVIVGIIRAPLIRGTRSKRNTRQHVGKTSKFLLYLVIRNLSSVPDKSPMIFLMKSHRPGIQFKVGEMKLLISIHILGREKKEEDMKLLSRCNICHEIFVFLRSGAVWQSHFIYFF